MIRQTAAGRLLHDLKNRGFTAWITSLALMSFYILLYFSPYAPQAPGAFDFDRVVATKILFWLPEASHPGRWTLYGLLYSIAVVLGGAWMIRKYHHNKYQVVRTSIVMFVQVSFGFSVPILLKLIGQPEYYFSYFWPLKFDYFQPNTIINQPLPLVLYSFLGSLVLVPIMTLLYGKRWYCSWVCGCGGLANTFGEPWRHLSSKSSAAWKFEKVAIHTVLVLALLVTATYALGHVAEAEARATCHVGNLWGASPDAACVAQLPPHGLAYAWFASPAYGVANAIKQYYGIIVLSMLSGVLGTGLYPIGGTRVWCRNFCPMAALLGLIQKLGRFRIRVKRDMCISCGMCSKYCEMGIDVRSYAQANKSFTRASCVGCGMCAEVCPRGVLRLENVAKRDPQELSLAAFIDESWKSGASAVVARD